MLKLNPGVLFYLRSMINAQVRKLDWMKTENSIAQLEISL